MDDWEGQVYAVMGDCEGQVTAVMGDCVIQTHLREDR